MTSSLFHYNKNNEQVLIKGTITKGANINMNKNVPRGKVVKLKSMGYGESSNYIATGVFV